MNTDYRHSSPVNFTVGPLNQRNSSSKTSWSSSYSFNAQVDCSQSSYRCYEIYFDAIGNPLPPPTPKYESQLNGTEVKTIIIGGEELTYYVYKYWFRGKKRRIEVVCGPDYMKRWASKIHKGCDSDCGLRLCEDELNKEFKARKIAHEKNKLPSIPTPPLTSTPSPDVPNSPTESTVPSDQQVKQDKIPDQDIKTCEDNLKQMQATLKEIAFLIQKVQPFLISPIEKTPQESSQVDFENTSLNQTESTKDDIPFNLTTPQDIRNYSTKIFDHPQTTEQSSSQPKPVDVEKISACLQKLKSTLTSYVQEPIQQEGLRSNSLPNFEDTTSTSTENHSNTSSCDFQNPSQENLQLQDATVNSEREKATLETDEGGFYAEELNREEQLVPSQSKPITTRKISGIRKKIRDVSKRVENSVKAPLHKGAGVAEQFADSLIQKGELEIKQASQEIKEAQLKQRRVKNAKNRQKNRQESALKEISEAKKKYSKGQSKIVKGKVIKSASEEMKRQTDKLGTQSADIGGLILADTLLKTDPNKFSSTTEYVKYVAKTTTTQTAKATVKAVGTATLYSAGKSFAQQASSSVISAKSFNKWVPGLPAINYAKDLYNAYSQSQTSEEASLKMIETTRDTLINLSCVAVAQAIIPVPGVGAFLGSLAAGWLTSEAEAIKF